MLAALAIAKRAEMLRELEEVRFDEGVPLDGGGPAGGGVADRGIALALS